MPDIDNIIETVRNIIDDCAATSDEERLKMLSFTLQALHWAAASRGNAVGYRVRGYTDDAMRQERLSEKYLAAAVKDGTSISSTPSKPQKDAPPARVRLRWGQITASGKRTSWAKLVHDFDRSQRGSKAIRGEYLQPDDLIELPAGQIAIEVRPQGSVKNGWQEARILRAYADGWAVLADGLDWRTDWPLICDALEEALRG